MGLFGKSEPKKPSSWPSSPAPPPRPATPGAPLSPPASAATVIGPEARISGELTSSDNVRVDGKVEGKIKSSKHLIIGENGYVHAEVEAEVVTIRGKLEGDCHAQKKAEITGTGKVFGNINAPVIAVAEGAVFRGASHMGEVKTTPVTKPGEGLPSPSPAPKDKEKKDEPSTH